MVATTALVLPAAVELIRLPVRIIRFRLAGSGSTASGDHLIAPLFVLYAVSVLVAGTAFIAWLFRVRRNAEAIAGAPHRYPVPWLVIGWIVPVAGLWIPRRIVLDVWKGSAYGEPARPAALVDAWWTCYLAGTVGGTVLAALFTERNSVRAATAVYAATSAFGVAAATLAAVLIWRIVALQEESAARLAAVRADEPRPAPHPSRRRQIVVAAVSVAGIVVLSVAARLLPHAISRAHVQNPERKGYAYGIVNPDPTVADCDQEATRRYGSGGNELAFATGCLQAQLDTLDGAPEPVPSP